MDASLAAALQGAALQQAAARNALLMRNNLTQATLVRNLVPTSALTAQQQMLLNPLAAQLQGQVSNHYQMYAVSS